MRGVHSKTTSDVDFGSLFPSGTTHFTISDNSFLRAEGANVVDSHLFFAPSLITEGDMNLGSVMSVEESNPPVKSRKRKQKKRLPALDFPELAGRFEVEAEVGRGTFSSVYRAYEVGKRRKKDAEVAIKRVKPTSRPSRVLMETHMLKQLGGKNNVVAILGGLRDKDQISLVLEYCNHSPFEEVLPWLTQQKTKLYLNALFQALRHIHSFDVIHRDIKPSNFLVDMKKNKFLLVDFGLAQYGQNATIIDDGSDSGIAAEHGPERGYNNDLTNNSNVSSNNNNNRRSNSRSSNRNTSPSTSRRQRRGVSSNTNNNNENVSQNVSTKKASRAGTRGFRAPEVLLMCHEQTTAIDMWASGVILLSIVTKRYPFFHAPDDMTALAEIGALVGSPALIRASRELNRDLHLPVHTAVQSLKKTCLKLAPKKKTKYSDEIYELLALMLTCDPKKRITAADALALCSGREESRV